MKLVSLHILSEHAYFVNGSLIKTYQFWIQGMLVNMYDLQWLSSMNLFTVVVTKLHTCIKHTYMHSYIHQFTHAYIHTTLASPLHFRRLSNYAIAMDTHTHMHTYIHTYMGGCQNPSLSDIETCGVSRVKRCLCMVSLRIWYPEMCCAGFII